MSTSENCGPLPTQRLPIRVRNAFTRWLSYRQAELSVWCDVRAFPALAVWGGLDCVAAMILVQRAAAGSALKLTSAQLNLTATVAAVLAILARALLARIEARSPAAWLRFLAVCAAVGPIVTLLFGSSRRLSWGTTGFVGFLAIIVGLATWLWSREFVERLLAAFLTTPQKHSGMTEIATFHSTPLPERCLAPESAPASGDSEPTLWMRRIALPGGEDRLEGAVFVDFASGQCVTTVHVSFCPAFAGAPQFRCDVRDAPDVRVKGSAVYPYGCRLELKRNGALNEAARVEIRFSASLSKASMRAA
jgi:hypothetical protein